MKSFRAGWLALAAAVSGCQAGGGEPTPDADGLVPVFNGRDLSGWVQILDSAWVVEEGALLSRQDPAGRREGESWLFTERDYEDFVLQLKFRLSPGGNSGVFFRDPLSREERRQATDGGEPPWEAGYEVNINSREPNYPTGSVWATAKGPGGLEKEGEWNDLEIRVVGSRIWTRVNGRPSLEGSELPPRSRKGGIGLQRHGGEAFRDKLIEVKDVAIREL